MVNQAPLSRIFCLARLIRWPTVASGTSSARAISAVLNPPTARKVRATSGIFAAHAIACSRFSTSIR